MTRKNFVGEYKREAVQLVTALLTSPPDTPSI